MATRNLPRVKTTIAAGVAALVVLACGATPGTASAAETPHPTPTSHGTQSGPIAGGTHATLPSAPLSQLPAGTTPATRAPAARTAQQARALRAKLHISRSSVKVRKAIKVTAAGSKARAGVRKVVFRFGDGHRTVRHGLPASAHHKYRAIGPNKVTLTITDKRGRTRKDSAWVTVTKVKFDHATGGLPSTEEVTPDSPLVGADTLPASVDLTNNAVQVGNQGQVSSCAAWSIGYGMMGWYMNQGRRTGSPFAPMYAYSQANNGVDKGSQPYDVLDVLFKQGVDTAAHYGSGWATDWKTRPNTSQTANAWNYRISGWRPLFAHSWTGGATSVDVYNLKAELSANHPVAISMELHATFDHWGSGTYHGGGSGGGLHEMLALGYNSTGLLVQNSWGTNWGSQGYVRVGWDAVANDLYRADTATGLVNPTDAGDSQDPTTSDPRQTLTPGDQLLSNGVPVTISWSGSDNTGVASYDLWASVNGADWSRQTLPSATTTSIRYALAPGSSYRFAVRAIDGAGNIGAWSYGASFTVGDYQETHGALAYSTSWQRVAYNDADGGYVTVSSTPNAWVTFRYAGRNVAWVATRATNRGQANVFTDNIFQVTADTGLTSTAARSLMFVDNAVGAGATHTFEADVVGTSGRPTVDVDSFIVLY